MKAYLDLVERVLTEGVKKENRTGVDTIGIVGGHFEHEMSNGFPLLTTKKMFTGMIRSELEFFIKGLTDKKWLQDRGNTIWNKWCNPQIVPYSHDDETKAKMAAERDLGPIYGFQWRHFGAKYGELDDNPIINFVKLAAKGFNKPAGYEIDYSGRGYDQLGALVDKLKTDPNDRRMIVSAWNPNDLDKMALPPCHYSFQVVVYDGKLNLTWNQRSIDTMIGLPFNIASYGFLLHLLAKESGFEEGKLIGNLGDLHIYDNHIDGAKEQLRREPLKLPTIETEDFTSIFEWEYKQTKGVGYKDNHHPRIDFDIAV